PAAIELAAPVPNPARGSVMFRFRMTEAGAVQLGMYDVAGRMVRTCVDGWFEAGEYLKGLDLAGVQPGVYFCILRAPGGNARTAFVVTR
ncbi:MAG TPA: T9SS type A sorting domain-containing protein, partial [Verrucomicrobiae bacterium]|nr:T9SS type A sorting domain-containing protein [Verrucomicrobiae bacterium]